MAAKKRNLNLLPKELAVSEGTIKVAKRLQSVAILVVVVFVIIAAGGGGLVFYFSNNLNNLVEEQDRLETNIKSLQETEQRLILVKDRVTKIQELLATRTNEEVFSKHKILLDNLPSELSLEGAKIDTSESSLQFTATNSRDLVSFMASVLGRSDFSRIVMDSLTFNPLRGYEIDLEIF